MASRLWLKVLVLPLSAIGAGCASVGEQEAASASASQQYAEARPQVVCTSRAPLGTRIKRQACGTSEEAETERAAAQDIIRQQQAYNARALAQSRSGVGGN